MQSCKLFGTSRLAGGFLFIQKSLSAINGEALAEGFPSAFAMRTDEPRVSAFHAALGCLKRVDLLFGFTCNFGDSMPVLLKQAVRIKAQCIQSGSHIFTVSGVAVRIGKGPIHIRRRGQVQSFFVNGEASASFFFLHRLNDHVRSRSEAIVHNFLSGCIANLLRPGSYRPIRL